MSFNRSFNDNRYQPNDNFGYGGDRRQGGLGPCADFENMDLWNSRGPVRGQRRDQRDMDINNWYNDWSRQCGPMNDGYDNRPPGRMPPMRPPPPGMMGPPLPRMPPPLGPRRPIEPMLGPRPFKRPMPGMPHPPRPNKTRALVGQLNKGPRMMAPSGKPLRSKAGAKTDNAPPHIFKSLDKMPRAVRSRYDQVVGLIVTQMKETLMVPPKNMAVDQNELKLLRENIRKRLNQLLLNKTVPSSQEILNLYRKSHPRTSDEAFLTEIQGLIDKEGIAFVKQNVAAVLQENLDDMFAKFQNIYGIEPNVTANGDAAPAAPSDSANGDSATPSDAANGDAATPSDAANGESATPSDAANGDSATPCDAANDTNQSNEVYARIVEGLVKKTLPKLLPAFKDTLISIMCQYKNIEVTDKPEEQPKEAQEESGEKMSVD